MSLLKKLTEPRVVLQMLIFIVLVPLLPLLISWRWDWWEAWVFAIIFIGGFIVSRALAAKRNPDLLIERARFLDVKNVAAWDKILVPLVGLGGALIPMTVGLEARSGGILVFSLPVKLLALAIFLTGFLIGSYALIENRYFSGLVHLQPERGHHVVSSGPYRCVRHPGYAGPLLTYLAIPFFLDSLWAFLPVLFTLVVLVVRTSLEDRFLQENLAGYRDYAGRVRYRLFPGIW